MSTYLSKEKEYYFWDIFIAWNYLIISMTRVISVGLFKVKVG